MLRPTRALLLLCSFSLSLSLSCSDQQFNGSAVNKAAKVKDSQDGQLTTPEEQSPGESTEAKESTLTTGPIVMPVPVAGAYLTCSFISGVDLLCSPAGTAQASATKVYSISGRDSKWTNLTLENTAEGAYLVRSVPEAAFALAFVQTDGGKKFVYIPERILPEVNLIADGSFEQNQVTDKSGFQRFQTQRSTLWSFEGSECSAFGGFMDLALYKFDDTYQAFAGNQWASLENKCRVGTDKTDKPYALYQNLTLKSIRAYLLRFAVRSPTAMNPKSSFEIRYKDTKPFQMQVTHNQWQKYALTFSGNDVASALSFSNADLNNPMDIDDIWVVDLGTL
jgi:hypothetical protein